MTLTNRLLLLLPLSVVLVFGCSKPSPTPAKLSGTVKSKGNLVTGGILTVYPKAGGAYPITIDADGKYAGADLPVGDAEVTIDSENLNPKRPGPESYGGGKGKGSMSPMPKDMSPTQPKGKYVPVNPKYHKKETSGLTVTLKAGATTKDFDLPD